MDPKPTTAWLDGIEPGWALPELRLHPSEVQLFRFSAVSWNAHRIHFDSAYAEREGYRAPLVHSQLLGSLLSRVVTDWLGTNARLTSLSWRNRAPAFVGELIVVQAVIRQIDKQAATLDLDLAVRDGAGTVLVQGTASAKARTHEINNDKETT